LIVEITRLRSHGLTLFCLVNAHAGSPLGGNCGLTSVLIVLQPADQAVLAGLCR
jgi:hypothetical protein